MCVSNSAHCMPPPETVRCTPQVNNAMGTKSCATWMRQSHNETEGNRSYKKLEMQDKYHGQVRALPRALGEGDPTLFLRAPCVWPAQLTGGGWSATRHVLG
jgi:hypothetical protein